MTQTQVPTGPDAEVPRRADADHDAATRVFSTSILISAIRCTLSYVVFPWVLPLIHASDSIGPWIGLPVGAVAIVSNAFSIRRFWRADHRWKWPVSVLNVAVLILVAILVVQDILELTT